MADKSGDVYLYPVSGEDGGEEDDHLLLGHLSVLLDLRLDRTGRYLVTCDRDEKIRVSRFPNSYNIHNYCLGHTEFVTAIDFLGEDRLVSGGGDGTCR